MKREAPKPSFQLRREFLSDEARLRAIASARAEVADLKSKLAALADRPDADSEDSFRRESQKELVALLRTIDELTGKSGDTK